AATPVGSRLLELLHASIAKTLQLLLDGVCTERAADVELGRFGVHLRRQRPTTTFELCRDRSIEMEDPNEQAEKAHAEDERDPAPNLPSILLEFFRNSHSDRKGFSRLPPLPHSGEG